MVAQVPAGPAAAAAFSAALLVLSQLLALGRVGEDLRKATAMAAREVDKLMPTGGESDVDGEEAEP
jgi:hypothetical protein